MSVKTATYGDIESRNEPSLFAPPLAWAVAHFTRLLIQDDGRISPDDTAIIVASDECSLQTIRELSRSAAMGAISPLRFAGASPSIIVGLAALQQGIRGPSLCLTMPPQNACAAISAAIDYWIRNNQIEAVIAIAHHRLDENRQLLKGLVARSIGDELNRCVRQLGAHQTDRELR